MAPEEIWVLQEKTQKDLITVHKYLIGERKEDELFLVVPSGRIRYIEHKLKHVNSI